MKYVTGFVLLICITSNVHAQTKNIETVKVYLNGAGSTFKSFNFDIYNGKNQRNRIYDYLYPSFAYQWNNKRNNAHEIELSRCNIRTEDKQLEQRDPNGIRHYIQGQQTTTTTIAFRYEYILNFGKKKKWAIQPSIGFAAMPYYHHFYSVPYVTIDYPTSSTNIGIRHAVIPRINVSLSKKLLLDINVPISVIDIGYNRNIIRNPTLPARAQEYGIVDVEVFPKYFTARISLGLKI